MSVPGSASTYRGYEAWKDWHEGTFGAWSAADGIYFSAELKRAGVDSVPGLKLYEIGFGNGSFAGYVKSLGCEYLGSEINPALVERGRQFGLKVVEGGIKQVLDAEQAGSVHAVVAFDVLEHLEIAEITQFLIDARALLRPGGVVLARVPSGDSPFGRAIFHGDLTHRTALGSSAVRQLAARTGFEVKEIGSPQLPVLGLGVKRALRRGGIRAAQTLVTRLTNLVFHDGQPRVITANLVFVLRKPGSSR
jgi:SAM-dependent methyltransferase